MAEKKTKTMYSEKSHVSTNQRVKRRKVIKTDWRRGKYTVIKPKQKILQKPGNKVKYFTIQIMYKDSNMPKVHLMR